MKKLFFAVLFLVAHNANAALIDNGSYTSDTKSGLDWLDISASQGMSFNAVSAELGSGGLFEGWSIANGGQVAELLANVANIPYWGYTRYLSTTTFDQLVDYLGHNRSSADVHQIDFLLADRAPDTSTGESRHYYGTIFNFINGTTRDSALIHHLPVTDTHSFSGLSTMLVRTTQVSEPGVLTLFGLGLLSLLMVRRKAR